MKNNFVKYIFILFVIGLIGFAIYKIYYEEEEKPMQTTVTSSKEETIITNIRIPVVSFDTINPIISQNKNIQDISKLIYEPLLKINEKNQIELCLAKEWSKVSGDVYLIKLKEDIKWHDNMPFEARDVQFTIDRLKNEASSSIYAWNVQHIISVEVIDEHTIRITLDSEIPFFEYNLTFPIMANHYYINQDFMTTAKNNNPVGTGQFKAIENKEGVVTLKKNTQWWNIEKEDSRLENIIVNKYSNMGEVYNAFKIGNIDLLTTSNINTEGNIGTIGFQIKEYRGRELDYIALNTNNTVLQNVEVRKAIQYAIDKQNIVASIYNNKYYITNFPLDGTNYLYNQDKIQYEHNQDKAKALLVDNGWEYKYKQWQKVQNYKTQRINLNLVVKASNENRVKVAEIIKNQLEAIGMKINLIKASDSQYQNYLKNKNYDMILTGVYLPYSPDLNTYFGENNLANFANEELKYLISEVKNITKVEVLQEKYARIQQIYNEQIPYVFLYNNKETLIYSPNLVGNIEPYGYNIFNNITTWYRK